MRIGSLAPSIALCCVAACAPRVVTTPVLAPVAGSDIRYSIRPDTSEFTRGRMVSLDSGRLTFERFVMDRGGQGGHRVSRSIGTDSIATLQVRIGRRDNAGRGALIGAIAGLGLGFVCAAQESGWGTPSPGQCMVLGPLSWAATGALIGLLVRSDIWAPAALPPRPSAEPGVTPPVTLLR